MGKLQIPTQDIDLRRTINAVKAYIDAADTAMPATVFAMLSGGATATSAGVLTVSAGHIANSMLSTTAGDIGGASTSYTPTFTAATTDPVLGTGGTATGIWTRIGKYVYAKGSIQFGTAGASVGVGSYSIGLPTAAVSGAPTSTNLCGLRMSNLNHATSKLAYFTGGIITSGASSFFVRYQSLWPSGVDTTVSAANPAVLVVNNATLSLNGRIEFAILYETA